MWLSGFSLLLLIIVGLIGYSWIQMMRSKEAATRLCADYCEKRQWQFLDEMVALKSCRLSKRLGKLSFEKQYQFDYCDLTGKRFSASVTLLGNDAVWHLPVENHFEHSEKKTPKVAANDAEILQFPRRED